MDLKEKLDSLKKSAEQNLMKPNTPATEGMKWVMNKEKSQWIEVPVDSPTQTSSESIETQAAIDELIFSLADDEELESKDFGNNLEGFISDGLIQEVKEPLTLNAKVANKLNKGLKFYAATDKLFDIILSRISSYEQEFSEVLKKVIKISNKEDILKVIRQSALKNINLSRKNLVINSRTKAVLGTLIRQSKNGMEVRNPQGKVSLYWPQEIA